ncbi:uncharacterized protein IWZ02DRAFT_58955 [Phyllosticta citriasiana]|uniref:uncharacterized protein n=1 Tax=Phyllosticta citriasiana TaxID=595635 RepID=UPI0030FDAC11
MYVATGLDKRHNDREETLSGGAMGGSIECGAWTAAGDGIWEWRSCLFLFLEQGFGLPAALLLCASCYLLATCSPLLAFYFLLFEQHQQHKCHYEPHHPCPSPHLYISLLPSFSISTSALWMELLSHWTNGGALRLLFVTLGAASQLREALWVKSEGSTSRGGGAGAGGGRRPWHLLFLPHLTSPYFILCCLLTTCFLARLSCCAALLCLNATAYRSSLCCFVMLYHAVLYWLALLLHVFLLE